MRHVILLTLPFLFGCAEINNMRTDISAKPPYNDKVGAALVAQLENAYDDKGLYKVKPTDDDIKVFIDSGITLSDYYCDIFFRNTNRAVRHRRFTRNTTNDVGGMVATILGLAKAGSGVTGGVAAGFSFADSGFRNYDESFMVDPDLAKMQRLVIAAQDNMKVRIFADPPKSFPAAESAIIRYAGLCSFLGMQDLLNDSVNEKTNRIETDTGAKQAGGVKPVVPAGAPVPAPAAPAAPTTAPVPATPAAAPPPPPTV